MCRFVSIFAVLVLLSPLAHAVTVTEDFFGDFNGQTIALDLGDNTITGRQSAGTGRNDFDPFRVTVPASVEIAAIRLTYFDLDPAPGTFFLGRRTSLEKCGGSLGCMRLAFGGDYGLGAADNIIPQAGVERAIFGDQLPLVRGTYLLMNDALSYTSGGGGTWSYTFSFETVPSTVVPLPASVVLLAAGLSGLTMSRLLRRVQGARAGRP